MSQYQTEQTVFMTQNRTPMIVTGVLVEEPNNKLKRWIKACSLTYFIYYVYMFVRYLIINPPLYYWIHLLFMCFFLSLFLPVCGLSSSKKSHNGSLALFAGVQSFLTVWNIFLLMSMWTSMGIVVSTCKKCEKIFNLGNKTCVLDSLSESIEITSDECLTKHPTTEECIFSILYIALATVSLMTAIRSRKTNKAKIAQLIAIEPVFVNQNTPPIIPPTVPSKDETCV
jgi:hypothetical protein